MRLIILYCLIAFMFSCDNPYKKVVRDFNFQSHYISINISNKEDTVPIVIENADLYNLLNCNGLLSEKDYENKIYPIVANHKVLYISRKIFEKLKEYKVIEINKGIIESLVRSQKIEKINTFFRDSILSPSHNIYLQNRYLIYCLFKKKIIVKIDDETGILYARK